MNPLIAVIDWHALFFVLFAAIACVFAFGVLFTSNVVRMAFYLVLSLGATAGLFFLAGAEFVGAMQLMIYVGGTMVLLIFGVMLTAQKSFVSMETKGGDWVLVAAIGGALQLILITAAFSVNDWNQPYTDRDQLGIAESKHTTQIAQAVVGNRIDKLDQENELLRDGMSGYLLPFEIVSVHLLVVLIGAAYLARAKKRAKPSRSSATMESQS